METMLEKIDRLESEVYGLQLRVEQYDTKVANLAEKMKELECNSKKAAVTATCSAQLSGNDVLEIIKKSVNLDFVNKLYRK